MKKVYMFPGQGSQKVGMGSDVLEKYSTDVDSASELLGYDLKKLILEDSEGQLNLTNFTQPALYTINALMYKQLEELGSSNDLMQILFICCVVLVNKSL